MKVKITGTVFHGSHVGRKLGFPTANLDRRQFVRLEQRPKLGIYAAVAEVEKKIYKAAVVIGPIDKARLPKVEAHLLNFVGNLYGKKIHLTLIKYIRAFAKYSNDEALKKQIAKDVLAVKKLTF